VEWCCSIVFISLVYNGDEVTYLAAKSLPWILLLLACLNLYVVQQTAASDIAQRELAHESVLV
ncbi:MAG: hypothetical protein WA510_02630, partial [Acidobacteriaceae bacterium]